MYRGFVVNVLGLLAGVIAGFAFTATLQAQVVQDGTQAHPYLLTQSGGWNKALKCAAQNIAWTVGVDGAAPVTAPGVTYTATTGPDAATYPWTALFPFSQLPPAARTVGPHTLTFNQPATTILLADGITPYTYPAAIYTEYVITLADAPTTQPPKDGGWRKILGTIAAFFRSLLFRTG
jgi:hypothetical protein